MARRVQQFALLPIVLAVFALDGCSDPSPQPPPYQGVELRKDVLFATGRRWETHKLEWVDVREDTIRLLDKPPADKLGSAQITVLIHGYATRDKDISPYFAGLIDHLLTDRGHTHPLVIYDWPSLARHWNNLTSDEQWAYIQFLSATVGEKTGGRIPGLSPNIRWEIQEYTKDARISQFAAADGLLALLKVLRSEAPDSEINLIAHSLGSRVVASALARLEGGHPRIRTIVLIAPDLEHDALEKSYWATVTGKVHVFYSRHDSVLSRLSSIMNFSLRLGASGPRDRSVLAGAIELHNVADILGLDDAHSSYLTRAGAAAIQLGDVLQ